MLCLYISWRWNTKNYCFYCQNMYLSMHELVFLLLFLPPHFLTSQLQRSHFKPGWVTSFVKNAPMCPISLKEKVQVPQVIYHLDPLLPALISSLLLPTLNHRCQPYSDLTLPQICQLFSSLSPLSEKRLEYFHIALRRYIL